MPAETLAEILAEAERLERKYVAAREDGLDSTANALWDEKCSFWDEHGPRLVAVARAAERMREGWDVFVPDMDERIAAFDALASGTPAPAVDAAKEEP